MKLLDRITRKSERDQLSSLVKAQEETLKQTKEALDMSAGQAARLDNEVRNLQEQAQEIWNTVYGVAGIGGLVDKRALLPEQIRKLREASNKAYYETPEGKAIIKNLTNYIIGKGVQWTAQDENPEVQRFIDDFADAAKVRFRRRQFSVISRTLREGELFVHVISNKQGATYALRFYRPFEIKEIEKDPEDAETVTAYKRVYSDPKNGDQEQIIPADEIVHIRLDADEDVDRGWPLLSPVLKRITQYGQWLEDRIQTNKAKTAVYLDVSVDGTAEQVGQIAGGLPKAGKEAFTLDGYAVQAPRSGTRWVHSSQVKAQWVNPEINAGDCKDDGRQILLSIASGVQMPEFILSSDASNANYSSTMMSESPFIKAVESFQTFFEEQFKLIFAIVIRRGIAAGRLPENSTETVMKESGVKQVLLLKAMREAATSPDVKNQLDGRISTTAQDPAQYEERVIPTKTEVDFSWPSIVSRDIWTETQAVDVHYQNKWCSKQTAQMKFGYDPDEENRKIEKEHEEEDAYKLMKGEVEILPEGGIDGRGSKAEAG